MSDERSRSPEVTPRRGAISPGRWAQLEPFIHEALDLSLPERDDFIERIASNDRTLGADLRRLLSGAEGGSVLDAPAAERFPSLLRDDLSERLADSLGARYTIERELARGGMARVFVAREVTLHRQVVVKVLAPNLSAEIDTERFEREIQLAASLQQANIVPLLAAGRAERLAYYVMPYVEGRSLRERIAREGALPLRDALNVLRDVTRALAYAHDHGVVHRDIKPGNILLSGGAAVVIDFGIATALDVARDEGASHRLTATGTALGTPLYMAPEQAVGDPATDHRADIYALGAMAYELLSGSTPFRGGSPQQVVAAHLMDTPVPIERGRPSIPPALAALVMRCLAKRPEDRPQSAREIGEVLDGIALNSGSVQVAGQGTVRAASTFRWPIAGAIAFIAIVAVGGAVTWYRHQPPVLNRQRIVVTPFRNLTGDPSADPIGSLVAEGIAGGLEQLDSITVVSSHTGVTDATGHLRSLAAIDPRVIGEERRAGRAVAGSFSRRGDTLRLSAEIIDVRTGTVERSIDPVAGPIADPTVAIERMRDQIATAFEAAGTRPTVGTIGHVPKLAAYREFAASFGPGGVGIGRPAAIPHLIDVTRLDSTFTLAQVLLATDFALDRQWQAADSVVRMLARHRDTFTPVERDWFASADAMAHSRYADDYIASRRIYARDSSTIGAGSLAYDGIVLNKPREVLALLRAFPLSRLDDFAASDYWGKISECDHMLGDYSRELTDATRARMLLKTDARQSVMLTKQIGALAAMGDTSLLRRLVDSSAAVAARSAVTAGSDAAVGVGRVAGLYELAARELLAHGHTAASAGFATSGLSWHDAHSVNGAASAPSRQASSDAAELTVARLLALARRYDAAAVILARLAEHDTSYSEAWIERAIVAADRGDSSTAVQTMAGLDSLARLPYAYGRPLVEEARVAAALGRMAMAVGLLDRAMRAGAPFDSHWHSAAEFHRLLDYAPFRELIAPKG